MGCAVKAHGADAAYQVASELALLAGAAGFTAESRTAKIRADLNALLCADGIHDSLYRAVGRTLVTPERPGMPLLALPSIPAMGDRPEEALAIA
jgi:alkylation response protein AidB-like acyl-CoA dehydrogenase